MVSAHLSKGIYAIFLREYTTIMFDALFGTFGALFDIVFACLQPVDLLFAVLAVEANRFSEIVHDLGELGLGGLHLQVIQNIDIGFLTLGKILEYLVNESGWWLSRCRNRWSVWSGVGCSLGIALW